jgi:hypothetical protein
MARFLTVNKDVFTTTMADLRAAHVNKMTIDTGNSPPIKQQPYRVSPEMKSEIDRQVQEMLDCGVIRQSTSAFSSPVVMVKTKSGEYRFAVDYRKLNAITTSITHPLPEFEDVTDMLSGAQVFSTMDLGSGYWQIPMAEDFKA